MLLKIGFRQSYMNQEYNHIHWTRYTLYFCVHDTSQQNVEVLAQILVDGSSMHVLQSITSTGLAMRSMIYHNIITCTASQTREPVCMLMW